MKLELDHLAVTATTLEEGCTMVEESLGLPLQPGGRHVRFGTHNMLLGLEDGLYLEVIAIDRDARAPDQPRWFDLDRRAGPPRLGNWICRCADLPAMLEELPLAGSPVELERGDLKWRMAVPGDGRLPHDNMFPALMEWQCPDHPARRLTQRGCRLETLVISHPEAAALEAEIAPVLDDRRISFETAAPGLTAGFATPAGRKWLR